MKEGACIALIFREGGAQNACDAQTSRLTATKDRRLPQHYNLSWSVQVDNNGPCKLKKLQIFVGVTEPRRQRDRFQIPASSAR
ncbi:hypothetical protein [Bradyrhizobium sp. ARR65]|uniref:hypothetical protein n=1 Tax=Bradyrhizobium sp. ARR65 TaxID=1040989 RepID=UPI000463E6EE|nr:hypothetical protein [Bradyrhizobium sp. ARR65]